MIANLPALIWRYKSFIALGLLMSFVAYSHLRIKSLKKTKVNLQSDIASLELILDRSIDANKTCEVAKKQLQEANQQCALAKQINEANSKAELTRHEGALTDIQNKYEKLRKIKVVSKCARIAVDDSVIQLLQSRDNNQN